MYQFDRELFYTPPYLKGSLTRLNGVGFQGLGSTPPNSFWLDRLAYKIPDAPATINCSGPHL